ncbi:unnamed protein product [Pleuronectes platessa]|uniref:Uncharacterized protein n=1 Tax=Pleuronectes platessa TaxID=8262 RepID=A0A9N7YZ20_PLEPL|nr:unnamed protein product [Pleuronectes platessa]
MSRRRSTGDLVPKDVTEILAREARAQRGKRKPGSSLGQAFSWLKGSRRKKTVSNGLTRTVTGVTEAKLGLQNQDPAKGLPRDGEQHPEKKKKKKADTEINFSAPPSPNPVQGKAKDSWRFGRQEKLKTELSRHIVSSELCSSLHISIFDNDDDDDDDDDEDDEDDEKHQHFHGLSSAQPRLTRRLIHRQHPGPRVLVHADQL